jgi:hypothetical protein
MAAHPDPAQHVLQELEVDRLSDALAEEFERADPDTIETVVRAEFARRSRAPIQDFVPVFVERTLRRRFRNSRLA